MITNTMMININRNMGKMSDYYNQLSTGKRIQFTSDDPIIAARALKFRTSVKETQQYQKNVNQGISWMEITEKGFSNVNSIIEKVRELCVQGATDTYGYEDRKKIGAVVDSLWEQLGLEMNITYTGRYVFSGYRTDKPPVITEDSGEQYTVAQHFSVGDVQETKSYQNLSPTGDPIVNDIKIIKLPYNSTNNGLAGVTVSGFGAAVSKSASDPTAYDGSALTYIEETGEVVFPSGAAIPDTFDVNYQINSLKKGDLNPEVYFESTRLSDGQYFDMAGQSLEYEFGVNTRVDINSLAKDVYTDKFYADLKDFVKFINSVQVSSETELAALGVTGQAATDTITKQQQAAQVALQDRFSDMLAMMDEYSKTVSKEHADLGSRMNRLELIENRLMDDEVTYTSLLSKNEDTDYMEVIMNLKSAESIYQASLQTGAKIIQMTLANFIS
jgi:flagellar hook-associated protein 3 FlgL